MYSGEIDPQHHKFWLSVEYWKVFVQKTIEVTLPFVDFSKAFDSIHRVKMEQILLADSLPKETVAAMMMLYKNRKIKVRSPDEDTSFFDIVVGALQEDTLAPYQFIICLDYLLRTSIEWLYLGKCKKQKIPSSNDYGRGLRWWHSASDKYPRPSRIPATNGRC